MATVFDVAAYILKKQGSMTAMKLQKLVYYSQAWSLVWDEIPLFKNKIEAWANGPVVRALYEKHRGKFKVTSMDFRGIGNTLSLSKEQKETIDMVLKAYGKKPSQWLSELTHSEQPWKDARDGLCPGERGDSIISQAAMFEYYDSLLKASDVKKQKQK